MSLSNKIIRFSFSPSLTDSLFLFLCEEKCINKFRAYLSEENKKILTLYLEAMLVYFNRKSLGFEDKAFEILEKVREIKMTEDNSESFPIESEFKSSLSFLYSILQREFESYKKKDSFKNFARSLELKENTNCKLQDSGLFII